MGAVASSSSGGIGLWLASGPQLADIEGKVADAGGCGDPAEGLAGNGPNKNGAFGGQWRGEVATSLRRLAGKPGSNSGTGGVLLQRKVALPLGTTWDWMDSAR
ncbi:hypothetical protein CCHR01_13368 [Colletotrichum chrysophilum]|uniref:Uncharacterized protein n=1 Tax=Colletotrichum chrysophilum TaxID=1836956 RepID=A0AAD9A9L1_9PEZI|nr:hypothetical protein CCHR01_13368 [Colletotrichum chrysophilum]